MLSKYGHPIHLLMFFYFQTVNARNLPHFVANRFSLREPQRVAERLHFVTEIVTHGPLKTAQLTTGGMINTADTYVFPPDRFLFVVVVSADYTAPHAI